MKIIKDYLNNRKARNFGKLYHKAVNNLGGVEYATIEFKNKIGVEMSIIKKNKRSELIRYVISGLISFVTSLVVTLLFNK